jgi:mRNA interferase MazF
MKRGSIVIAAFTGDYGKSRPAVVVQTDILHRLPSVVLCPITSTIQVGLEELRVNIAPTKENGLREKSQVMIDKIVTVPRHRIGQVIGDTDIATMAKVTASLAVLLAIV